MQPTFLTTLVFSLLVVGSTNALVLPRSSNLAAPSLTFHRRSLSGQATFYGGNLHGGTCSFSDYTLPSGVYGTALSALNWANSTGCGACVNVQGPGGNNVTAMIVDKCPECGPNHLDLFANAFAALAIPSTGVIPISWNYMDCPITSPLELHVKQGASQDWFSMQVVNANRAVTKLEVSTDGGATWQNTQRQDYNFFQSASGFKAGTVDVRVTGSGGKQIVVKGVAVTGNNRITASGNL